MTNEKNPSELQALLEAAQARAAENAALIASKASNIPADGWVAMGFTPEIIYNPLPQDTSKKTRIHAIYQKHLSRVVSQKVWNLQNKILGLTAWLAVAGGVVSVGAGMTINDSFSKMLKQANMPMNPATEIMAYGYRLTGNSYTDESMTNYLRADLALRVIFGVTGGAIFARFGVPLLMRGLEIEDEKAQSEAAIKNVFCRSYPAGAVPVDLADPYRTGWIASDGKPISYHLVIGDTNHEEERRINQRWKANTWAFGLALAAFPAPISALAMVAPLFINYRRLDLRMGENLTTFLTTPIKNKFLSLVGNIAFAGGVFLSIPYSLPALFVTGWHGFARSVMARTGWLRGTSPATLRNRELVTGLQAESLLFTEAGSEAFTARVEAARNKQLETATKDKTPLFFLGNASGLMHNKGDLFAPSEGLPFALSLNDLFSHFLIFGGTGSGKTSGLLRPIIEQALEAENLGVLILDGKGALPAEYADYKGVKLITPENAIISLVAGVSPAILIDTLADVYSNGLSGTDKFWTTGAKDLMVNAAVLCHYLGGKRWSLSEVAKVALRDEYRNEIISMVIEKAGAEIPEEIQVSIGFFTEEWDEKSENDKTKSSIEAQARAFFSEFTKYPELRRWMDAPLSNNSFDVTDVLRGGKIALSVPENSYFAAGAGIIAMIKARIYSGIKARAEGWQEGETPLLMVIDEAQEVVTREDVAILPVARSLGLSQVAATQTKEGVMSRVSGWDKWLEVFKNIAVLKNSSTETYTWFANKMGYRFNLRRGHQGGIDLLHQLNIDRVSHRLNDEENDFITDDFGKPSNPYMAKNQNINSMILGIASGRAISSSATVEAVVNGHQLHEILVEPQTAFIMTLRGNVERRDLVILNPIYTVEKGATEQPPMLQPSQPPTLTITAAVI